jgi:hypothetical protein
MNHNVLDASELTPGTDLRRAFADGLAALERAGWQSEGASGGMVFVRRGAERRLLTVHESFVDCPAPGRSPRAYPSRSSPRSAPPLRAPELRRARLPHDFLDVCLRRIVKEVKGISRMVYDISGKPPATIEWE